MVVSLTRYCYQNYQGQEELLTLTPWDLRHKMETILLVVELTKEPWEEQLPMWSLMFCAIGFFNEADTLGSSSILIYSKLLMGLYTQIIGLELC